MSHFTSVKTQIFDKEILLETLKEMGFELLDSTALRGYGNRVTNVDFQVCRKNASEREYNIGFKKEGNSYNIVADWYGIRGRNQFEQDLKQKYSKRLILRETKKMGYRMISEQVQKGNTIKLVMRKL